MLTAIDVLLDPDAATVEKAQAANARLREDYPDGFALDANHAPHITILQRFVRTADLDEVANAVAEVLRTEQSMKWESNATSYYDLAYENLGLVGIVIEPTQDLRRLQQRIIDAIAPLAAEKGTGEAFAPRPDGGAISQPTVDYVNNFVGPHTGMNYHPHLTVGIGTRDFVGTVTAITRCCSTPRSTTRALVSASSSTIPTVNANMPMTPRRGAPASSSKPSRRPRRGWLVVDMKQDWNAIFRPE